MFQLERLRYPAILFAAWLAAPRRESGAASGPGSCLLLSGVAVGVGRGVPALEPDLMRPLPVRRVAGDAA
jgi:hypothetical protein